MFFTKADEILNQFSRNVEGYFLERDAETYEDIDEQVLIDLKEINKEAKRSVVKSRGYVLNGEIEKSKYHEKRATELMDKKTKVLNELICKHNINAIGYHVKKNCSKVIIYPLYSINGYSYHLKSDIDFVNKNNLKFLGELNNTSNYKTLGSSSKKSNIALMSIEKII